MSNTHDPVNDIHSYGIDIKQREIYLHSYIANSDDDPGVDYRMSSTFSKNIRILDSIDQSPILVHMHSIGGNWSDGMSIFDTIKMCRSHVTIIAYGQAESMSSIIFQAADARIMTPNAYFMAHYGSSSFNGNFLDAQSFSKFDLKCIETMLEIYAKSAISGKFFKEKLKEPTEEKVKNFLRKKLKDGDWYLTANEAVYYGFADGVLTNRNFKTIDMLKV